MLLKVAELLGVAAALILTIPDEAVDTIVGVTVEDVAVVSIKLH
jgi:hypothetical protein